MIVERMYPGARTIGRANRFSAISPVTNAFSGVIQTDLSYTPLFDNALWPYVFIPCVFGITVGSISVCLQLKLASDVFPDWRGVSFWRRSCSCQPKSQMIEDIPDHRRVLNTADDPHRPLASRTDQRIDFVGWRFILHLLQVFWKSNYHWDFRGRNSVLFLHFINIFIWGKIIKPVTFVITFTTAKKTFITPKV